MKRSSEEQLVSTSASKKPCVLALVPLGVANQLTTALEDACVVVMRIECDDTSKTLLSNQPLIIDAHSIDANTITQLAYWPANNAIGKRVIDALDDTLCDSEVEDEADADYADPEANMISALLDIVENNAPSSHTRRVRDRLVCVTLGIESLELVGTLRLVTDDKKVARLHPDQYVERALLHHHMWHTIVSY